MSEQPKNWPIPPELSGYHPLSLVEALALFEAVPERQDIALLYANSLRVVTKLWRDEYWHMHAGNLYLGYPLDTELLLWCKAEAKWIVRYNHQNDTEWLLLPYRDKSSIYTTPMP